MVAHLLLTKSPVTNIDFYVFTFRVLQNNIWLRFSGGKGVATGMAVITVVVPFTGLIMAATWLLVAAFTRISSLSALLSFVTAGLFTSFGPFENSGIAQITVWGVGLLCWARHKQNIQRILSGQESKISFSKKPSD